MRASATTRTTTRFIAACGVIFAIASTADAQDAASLAHEGEKLMNAGKYPEACAKLAESHRLDPLSSTALELGRCREKEGRPGSAFRAYGAAIDLGGKEGRQDRVTQARQARGKLMFKVARVSVNVPSRVQGMTVTIDGEPVPESAWGKEYESDPGTRTVAAEAPGHKRWEDKVRLTTGKNRAIAVPALQAAQKAAPKPNPKPSPGLAVDRKPTPQPEPAPPEPVLPPPEEPEDDGPIDEHKRNRFVAEIGALGGLLYSDIPRGDLSELRGVGYRFNTVSGGVLLASCGEQNIIPGAGDCEALFEPQAGGIVGGELFLAWAFHEAVHFGVRGFGGARLPEGWFVYGGPSVSFRVAGPLWLGATFLVGTEQHRAPLASARGSVPEEYRPANGASDQVDIPPENIPFNDGIVNAGLMFGGSIEIAISLVGPSPHAAAPTKPVTEELTGSFMVAIWPGFLKALPDGYAITVPGGFAYRFY
jgi:hypothetical protein